MSTGSNTATTGPGIPEPGYWQEVRKGYFATPLQSLATVLCLAMMTLVIGKLVMWGIVDAVWTGTPEACRGQSGACWAVIANRYRLILFGLYPFEEQWRSALACSIMGLTVILSCYPAFWSGKRLAGLWVIGFGLFYLLMKGGVFGLPVVLETEWGGLALTIFVFSASILIGMPTAIALALLRRSSLPVIAKTVALFIDGLRSLPLVSILFTFAIILPFTLPDILNGEKLYRVILGYALFYAVYQAEIIRGGMQAIPAGQEEAASALGLKYWSVVTRITLPQAFHYALPPTINQAVIALMETSLIVILGFFEITASGTAAFSGGGWNMAYIEVYAFIGAIYFACTFSLSSYGSYLERRMARDER